MNEEQNRAEFEAWWANFQSEHEEWRFADREAILFQAWQAAISAKSVPIGYIDRGQLARWEKLRGTEFERAERGWIGFSTKPFKTEMTDCTLAVYAAPQPTDERVRELQKVIQDLQIMSDDHVTCGGSQEYASGVDYACKQMKQAIDQAMKEDNQ